MAAFKSSVYSQVLDVRFPPNSASPPAAEDAGKPVGVAPGQAARQRPGESMTSDLDIYRSAQALVKQHGADAPIHAAMRADAMLEKGDLEGCAVWKRILRALEELQRAEPRLGEAVH